MPLFCLSLTHFFSFILSLCSPERTQRLEEVLCRAEGDDSLPAESNLNPLPTHTHTTHSHAMFCGLCTIICARNSQTTNYICQNVQQDPTTLTVVFYNAVHMIFTVFLYSFQLYNHFLDSLFNNVKNFFYTELF